MGPWIRDLTIAIQRFIALTNCTSMAYYLFVRENRAYLYCMVKFVHAYE